MKQSELIRTIGVLSALIIGYICQINLVIVLIIAWMITKI